MRRPPRETVSRSPLKPIVFPPVSFEEWHEEAGASVDRDEQELLRRCRMGDQAASTALVETYAGMVGTVIWRATGDGAAVEDLVQEVFLRVFRALPDFAGRTKLSTWIYTIAHRVAIDHRRRVDRCREDSGAGYDDNADLGHVDRWPTTTVIDPEAIAMQQQVGDLVRTGLAQLPDKYRLPLVYTSIEGLDHATVAAMLGVPRGTVKTLVFRGKQMLKQWIVDDRDARPAGRRVSDAM